MAYLEEHDIFTSNIELLDVNNDRPHAQLANRTIWLKNRLEQLNQELTDYMSTNDNEIIELKELINQIEHTINTITDVQEFSNLTAQVNESTEKVNNLISELQKHTFQYAEADTENGAANRVNILNGDVDNLHLVGSSDFNNTILKKNTNVYMTEQTLCSPQFKGDLIGNANSATELKNPTSITVTGDVLTTQTVKYNGTNNIVLDTALKEQQFVIADSYGPQQDELTVSASGTFKVPCIKVSSKGIITDIKNKVITLSNEIATSGKTSALPKVDKLYLLGALEQTNSTVIYSQNGVFAENGKLYSNNNEVVNLNDSQQLTNKVYNGYILKEGCCRGVADDTINGIENDNRLVTSNSLARHTHNYATSEIVNNVANGKAKYVAMSKTLSNNEVMYILGNNDIAGQVNKNVNIYYNKDTLHTPSLKVTDDLYIPGGKISINSVEVPVMAEDYTPTISKTTLEINNARTVALANSNITVTAGKILSYQTGGYVLANHLSADAMKNLVMACTDAVDGLVQVVSNGYFDIGHIEHDGCTCYLGVAGKIIYNPPTTGTVVKLGYMEGSIFIFQPTII